MRNGIIGIEILNLILGNLGRTSDSLVELDPNEQRFNVHYCANSASGGQQQCGENSICGTIYRQSSQKINILDLNLPLFRLEESNGPCGHNGGIVGDNGRWFAGYFPSRASVGAQWMFLPNQCGKYKIRKNANHHRVIKTKTKKNGGRAAIFGLKLMLLSFFHFTTKKWISLSFLSSSNLYYLQFKY